MFTLILQLITRIVCKPYLHLIFNFQISHQGWETSKAKGPLIIVSNHPGFFDFILIGVTLPLKTNVWPIAFLVSQSYASLKKGIIALFVRFGGGVTVTRTGYGEKSLQEVLQNAEIALKEKKILLIFPQGKMMKETLITKGGRGAAYLAMKKDIELVPYYIEKGRPEQRIANLFTRKKIVVRIGKPFFVKGNYDSNENLQQATVEIIDKINSLPYVKNTT